LESTVAQFGIQNKIRSVITDNAANMKKALSVFLESSNNDDSALDEQECRMLFWKRLSF